jgi:biopolymer transport protein ExbB
MIQMFMGILDHGVGDVGLLAGGIGKALISTAAGLIVAIPALMFHRYFRGRIGEYLVEMEHEATLLLDVLDPRAPRAPQA